jgi:uncharacterized protein GlcG (DUF336 family)
MRAEIAAALAAAALLASACGGSGGGSTAPACGTSCAAAAPALTGTDVQRAIAQAAFEAQARGAAAHIAVVDRVGNVLAVFSMPGAPASVAISSGIGHGGLDGIAAGSIPATLAAIAKAITGAYLSSNGNAFSTRTAGQIVREHFDPQEQQQPAGPLYGVQFSQLTCSDVNRNGIDATAGPKRSPLGLAADPGGLPLYKDGVLVGGIGVEADGIYGLDRDLADIDEDPEERIALAGATGLDAPQDIRAERITADGHALRFIDGDALRSDPSRAPPLAATPGTLAAVPGYSTNAIRAGTAYGDSASGVRPDTADFAASGGWIVTSENGANRFPVRSASAGAQPLAAAEVRALLAEALAIANRARGQIRRPLGSSAHVTIAVVDTNGEILGLVRTSDGPIFGIDVAVQKGRTALFFSSPGAAAAWAALPPAHELVGPVDVPLRKYLDDSRAFLAEPREFTGITAWTPRAIGNLHRPFYPDGIAGTPHGPLSTPIEAWSPFNVGFQLDLVYNALVAGIAGDTSTGCTGIAALRNGIQVFPGAVPIYRGDALAGAIGVSGDGVDQDDMVAYLGLANASAKLGAGAIGNAPDAMRADRYVPQGARLRYVQCPQSPFNGSSEQNVCG